MPNNISDRQSLRQHIRAKRRELTPIQQKKASANLLHQFNRNALLYRVKHVALYLANDGEISPGPILKTLRSRGIKCYLPILHPLAHNKLLFCEYNEKTKLVRNQYGIEEPCLKSSKTISPGHLNLVLLPLVAFDGNGNRMGMGGGYYDRTFAFMRNTKTSNPKLFGLAHECQKVEQLAIESWDIPLHGIVTDEKFYLAKNGKTGKM